MPKYEVECVGLGCIARAESSPTGDWGNSLANWWTIYLDRGGSERHWLCPACAVACGRGPEAMVLRVRAGLKQRGLL